MAAPGEITKKYARDYARGRQDGSQMVQMVSRVRPRLARAGKVENDRLLDAASATLSSNPSAAATHSEKF